MAKKISGSRILLESFAREGVDVFFGYPGAVLLGLYDQLYDSKIRHILPRHEQGGIHAAEGYAKATGKVGVMLTTSGPGATNIVTGIADAFMDSVPIVAITGQISTGLIGGDAFQEVDIVGITRPIVKHNYLVKKVDELAEVIKQAFHLARSGRPGPVLVDVPKDVFGGTGSSALLNVGKINLPGYSPNYEGNPNQLKKLLKGLSRAKQPIIHAGGGVNVSFSTKELTALTEQTGVPVCTSFMGQGAVSAEHRNYIGWLGMHGRYAVNRAVADSDFILAVGTRFSDRTTGKLERFAPRATIAHIDIDPASISKNIRIDIPVVGDIKLVLKQLLAMLKSSSGKDFKNLEKDRRDWLAKISRWNKEHPLTYFQGKEVIKPQYVIEKIHQVTNGEAIISTEVGQHQMWTGQFFPFKRPRQFLSSGGLGTMGFGFPAAIGAKIGLPDQEVVCVSGDGSFMMNLQELSTAVEQKLAIKVVILNNHSLGMVKQSQDLFLNQRFSHTLLKCQPDFVKLAESFGAVGLRGEKPAEVEPILRKAMQVNDVPVVVEFEVDPGENVFPMVPSDSGNDQMVLLEKGQKNG